IFFTSMPKSHLHMFRLQGLAPEIVPSKFPETLPHSSFEDLHEYPVATATHKAVEVYERLVVCSLSILLIKAVIRLSSNRSPILLLHLSLEASAIFPYKVSSN